MDLNYQSLLHRTYCLNKHELMIATLHTNLGWDRLVVIIVAVGEELVALVLAPLLHGGLFCGPGGGSAATPSFVWNLQ